MAIVDENMVSLVGSHGKDLGSITLISSIVELGRVVFLLDELQMIPFLYKIINTIMMITKIKK